MVPTGNVVFLDAVCKEQFSFKCFQVSSPAAAVSILELDGYVLKGSRLHVYGIQDDNKKPAEANTLSMQSMHQEQISDEPCQVYLSGLLFALSDVRNLYSF